MLNEDSIKAFIERMDKLAESYDERSRYVQNMTDSTPYHLRNHHVLLNSPFTYTTAANEIRKEVAIFIIKENLTVDTLSRKMRLAVKQERVKLQLREEFKHLLLNRNAV